jgi:hypothetical protein
LDQLIIKDLDGLEFHHYHFEHIKLILLVKLSRFLSLWKYLEELMEISSKIEAIVWKNIPFKNQF